MNHKKISLYLLIILIFNSFVSATSFEIYYNGQTSFDVGYVGYEGEIKTINGLKIKNQNSWCGIICSYQNPGDGEFRYINGKEVIMPSEEISFSTNILVGENQGHPILSVECHDQESISCSFSNYKIVKKTFDTTYTYCGDNIKNGDEQCDNYDLGGQTCKSQTGKNDARGILKCHEECYAYDLSDCEYCGDGDIDFGEQCDSKVIACSRVPSIGNKFYDNGKTARCKSDCSGWDTSDCEYCGDGIPNGNENCLCEDVTCEDGPNACDNGNCIDLDSNNNCGSIGNKCSSDENCINRVCENTCGDGKCEGSENCCNCKEDCPFGKNRVCSNNQCISLGTKSDCSSEGDVCNGKCTDMGDYFKCIECNTDSDCKNGKPCHMDKCGCPNGWDVCDGRCVEKETINIGKPCKCDIECVSGSCKDSKCIKTYELKLNSNKASLKPGETAILSLSVINNLDEDLSGKATIKIGTGAEISDIISIVGDCSGNTCSGGSSLPANGRKEFSVEVTSNSEITIPISATASYEIEGKKIQQEDQLKIEFIKEPEEISLWNKIKSIFSSGNEITGSAIGANDSKTKKNLLITLGAIISAIVIIVLSVYFVKLGKESEIAMRELSEEGSNIEHKVVEKVKNVEKKINTKITKDIDYLHSLHEKGVLTKEEFVRAKDKLLGK